MKVTLRVAAGQPDKLTEIQRQRVAAALTAAFKKGGQDLKSGARAAIAAGGFSGRVQNAFRVNIYPVSGVSLSPKIFGFDRVKYAGQFEDPETVTGDPFVWLPIEQNLPGGSKQRWTPALFTRTVGPLRGGRHGSSRPILFGQVSVSSRARKVLPLTKHGARAHPAAKQWMPVFIGVRTVHDPKRYNTTAVAERVSAELGQIFSQELETDG